MSELEYLLEKTGASEVYGLGGMAQLGKGLSHKHKDQSSQITNTHTISQVWWHVPVILMLGEQKWEGSWGLLASHLSLLGKIQAHERPHLTKRKVDSARGVTSEVDLWLNQ